MPIDNNPCAFVHESTEIGGCERKKENKKKIRGFGPTHYSDAAITHSHSHTHIHTHTHT